MWSLIPWKQSERGNGGVLSADPVDRMEQDFSRMRDNFERLVQQMWGHWPTPSNRFVNDRFGMGLDVDETDTHYIASLDAPGFEVEDFEVKACGNRLCVKAQRNESQQSGEKSFQRYGRMERSFTLPEGVEADQIEARYHSGVLELKIPKGQEAESTRRIEVKSA